MNWFPFSLIVAWLRPWLQLVKVPLCVPVACSAGFGAILHTPVLTPSCWAVICGVFFLACGAAGGNSLQEKTTDRLFARTCNRPLVTGRLTEPEAFWLSALLGTLGLAILWLGAASWSSLLLGITALVLYNGLYTPLKQTSVFALFPGGLAGAVPPLIGWTAAGGALIDIYAWQLFALFFFWQIPHFCIILLRHQEDYRAVERPSLIRLLPGQSLERIALVWILAFIVVALSLTLDRVRLELGSRVAIVLMCGMLAVFSLSLGVKKSPNYHFQFRVLNCLFFFTLLLVAVLQLYAFK